MAIITLKILRRTVLRLSFGAKTSPSSSKKRHLLPPSPKKKDFNAKHRKVPKIPFKFNDHDHTFRVA